MKKYIYLLLLINSFWAKSQVAIGTYITENKNSINEKYLSQFLKTETIFIFPSYYEKSVYEQILKETWTITPYRILIFGEVDLQNYLSVNYSFATIEGKRVERSTSSGGSVTSFYTYFSFFTYDIKEKMKEIEKFKKKSDEKKDEYDLFKKNKQYVAGFYLFQKDEIVQSMYFQSIKELSKSVYTNDVFYNFKPGFLKNYFQAIQKGIKDKQKCSVYDVFKTPEIKNLQKATLYIPNYVAFKFNPNLKKLEDTERDEEEKENLFSKYEFNYEYIDEDVLSQKIMDNEDIYYFRYVRMNNVKFLNVIEAKTGKIIYADRIMGLSYNLKSGQIKDISTAAKKEK